MKNKKAAIVVLFNPVLESILALVKNLQEQCDFVVLIDNTPENQSNKLTTSLFGNNVIYEDLQKNMGIAYAQNYGFFKAIELGCDIFFTFDQDSSIESDYVSKLVNEYIKSSAKIANIAALGPLIINERNNKQYDREIKLGREVISGTYQVDSIISSGALIPLNALAYIGLNKAEWFIDLIDIEWSYRARYLGWNILSTKNVTMHHNLGQQDINVLGMRSFAKCSPFRLYYVYRNWLLSNKEISFPLKYKIKKFFVMPCKFIIYTFSDNGLSRFKYMMKGIVDGLKGVTGPYK
jgi:rhamnosyltransferase